MNSMTDKRDEAAREYAEREWEGEYSGYVDGAAKAFISGVEWCRDKELKKLHDSLTRIATMSDSSFDGNWVTTYELREIAREALR